MPAVRRFLYNMTAVEPLGGPETTDGGVDPDEAVALGAAVQAGVLQGEVKGLMVMDQWQVGKVWLGVGGGVEVWGKVWKSDGGFSCSEGLEHPWA